MRIPEIEDLNRKRALLFLTRDPHVVLDFLGLDISAYKSPFESVESVYRYVCGCRFFSKDRYMINELKVSDRKRMAKREMYRAFVEDWLPKNAHLLEQRKDKNTDFSRDDVLQESLDRFGRREEYELRIEEWRGERGISLKK